MVLVPVPRKLYTERERDCFKPKCIGKHLPNPFHLPLHVDPFLCLLDSGSGTSSRATLFAVDDVAVAGYNVEYVRDAIFNSSLLGGRNGGQRTFSSWREGVVRRSQWI
ncbi:hypothetical protein RHGRI_000454 [Rhododendron griersonianum]|uniref:Uncharacterized protein n=1 Tax=Rhododendron griersonianum TaxID=479676 RepID=A0AAV6LIZ7_9ERIC|nr:hypothetical protein RHGRI_000454 [Rhododendron griersonianum]